MIGYHEIKDAQHWLSSPKREELFGPIGITNIRTLLILGTQRGQRC